MLAPWKYSACDCRLNHFWQFHKNSLQEKIYYFIFSPNAVRKNKHITTTQHTEINHSLEQA